jgi:hypothetical protein
MAFYRQDPASSVPASEEVRQALPIRQSRSFCLLLQLAEKIARSNAILEVLPQKRPDLEPLWQDTGGV